MHATRYNLIYEGYWLPHFGTDEPLGTSRPFPDAPGVYSVYVSTYIPEQDTAYVRGLVYIGETDNFRDRISSHEKLADWMEYLGPGEMLCFNFAPFDGDEQERKRVKAALIHEHQPPENKEHVEEFRYPETSVSTSGKNEMLSEFFTVP